MQLISTTNQAGAVAGEVWHTTREDFDSARLEVFVGYWHVPTARAAGEYINKTHRHAEWIVDVEGWAMPYAGGAQLHMERAFKTERRAREWFNFVAWCLESLHPLQVLDVMRTNAGRLT